VAEDENKSLIRRFYEEVWGRGNLDVAEEVFAADYERHDLRPTPAVPGPAGQKRIAGDFRAAFPDLRWNVELLVAEGDYVVGRWTAEGTHRGPWGAVEPTGRPMKFSGVNIFRFENSKVAEIWNYRDDLGLMQQLGVPVFAGSAGDS
jgi:steroid delta-isomerase-like uncharacterized protein